MSLLFSDSLFVGTQFFEQLNLMEEQAMQDSKPKSTATFSQNRTNQSNRTNSTLSSGKRSTRKRKCSSPLSPLIAENLWESTPTSGNKRVKNLRNSSEKRKNSTGSFHSPLSSSTPIVHNNLRRQSLQNSFKLKLSIENWGLPESVVEKYVSLGIRELFSWQVDCLISTKALVGGNLIYSAPTSAGKTLVSELLLLKTVTEKRKKGLYILPFVAVAREKAKTLQGLAEETGLRVESFAGNSGSSSAGFRTTDIAVCTIEKANSLVNRLLEEGNLHQLGIVVIDELHLVGDSHRGFLLELLLTKVLYNSLKHSNNIQIVGMSATLPNIESLGKWLKADIFQTDFRPVPLVEHIKIGPKIYNRDFQLQRELQQDLCVNPDPDGVIHLSLETILDGYSVLIFCPTKSWCEKIAQQISSEFFAIGMSKLKNEITSRLRENLNGELLFEAIEKLKTSPGGLDNVLGQTLRMGVAFHHAGLTAEEREILEEYFKRNIIKVLVATSTLSSGVNLPARRVIVRTPLFHGTMIDPLVYRQMIGRAGRQGRDTRGESYLICQPSERVTAERLMNAQSEPLKSCLVINGTNAANEVSHSLKRALLEVITTGIAITNQDLRLYASCTLLAASADCPESLISSCVDWLIQNEFVCQQTNEECQRILPSQLGLACLASSLSPDESLNLLSELQNARRGIILENDLHLLYQVTPTYVSDQWSQIDWLHYLNLWEALSEDRKRVGVAVGVEERFLVRAMKGTVNVSNQRQSRQMAIHKRFYTALALNELMNEVPLKQVVRNFKANKGMLQSLQQQTATFAGMVTIFCQRLGWTSLHVLLESFQSRLQFGVQRELCDLMRLAQLDSRNARVFYNAGFTNVVSIATASASNLELVIKNSSPFQSAKESEENSAKKSEISIDTFLLVQEARRIVQQELGAKIEWINQEAGPKEAPINVSRTQNQSAIAEIQDLNKTPENRPIKTTASVTPDLFDDSDSSVFNQSEKLPSQATPSTPNFAVCAEEIVTGSTNDNSSDLIEATPAAALRKCRPFKKQTKNSILESNGEESFFEATPISHKPRRCRSSTNSSNLKIIDVCRSVHSFNDFLQQWRKQGRFSLALLKDRPSQEGTGLVGTGISWKCDEVYWLEMNQRFMESLERFKNVLEHHKKQQTLCIVYDLKSAAKLLNTTLKIRIQDLQVRDVQLADWMLDPCGKSKSLEQLAKVYTLQENILSSSWDSDVQTKTCRESSMILKVYEGLEKKLLDSNLLESYTKVEMKTTALIIHMEDKGIAFDPRLCESLLKTLQETLKNLESQAHRIVGYNFALNSPKEVSRAMISLQALLPQQTEQLSFSHCVNPLKRKSEKIRKSVPKNLLVKLQALHPLPGIVLEYRKVAGIVQQIVGPLLKAYSIKVGSEPRIHADCQWRTATGRIIMNHPNLQMIPRPFQLGNGENVNLRNCFKAKSGFVFISADYSQLELRILAHLSGDEELCRILGTPSGDVFKLIAAKWKNKAERDIEDGERQQAKQICYGIVYGIGTKTLAEQLDLCEEEAEEFAATFRKTYPGVEKFIKKTVEECRRDGYVTTLLSRRRYLPAINSNNAASRAQAERQAVNSRIQGSASDLVKKAMILIHHSLQESFPESTFLVHQIHDELLYEVPCGQVQQFGRVIKQCMETATPMNISFPVNLKCGPDWGNLKPLKSLL